ncbi:MAG: aminotransferase class V-fold PLP-dependent enzyme [Planctomycetes bacterium]|nr:aminotransferase class V-fold PLP-dependent enzyme [Planctomycetota bacterium]MDA0947144.1 aminotransferase class V-fold PLP-dependent enzyme [Planctomycetota bacterium]
MDAIYLDHNATSPLRAEAREALLAALELGPLNASSAHAAGRAARALLDEARERVAGALGVAEEEVVFTSGGTEALNLAIAGAVGPGGRVAASAVEHPAVLAACERHAGALQRLPVDSEGALLPLEAPLEVELVAVQAANSETGTVQDLPDLSSRLRSGCPLLVDAVQALGKIPVDLSAWGADLAAFSAHKVGGPAGVGVLVRRGPQRLSPLLVGGGQEDGLRAGTEGVAAIHAASVAIALAVDELAATRDRVEGLTAALWDGLREAIPGIECNGRPPGVQGRLPNTLNVALPECDGRVLVTRLDLAGLQASAGSACSSGSLEPSPVLLAMGQDRKRARRGLRLSCGRTTTHNDIHRAVEILRESR